MGETYLAASTSSCAAFSLMPVSRMQYEADS